MATCDSISSQSSMLSTSSDDSDRSPMSSSPSYRETFQTPIVASPSCGSNAFPETIPPDSQRDLSMEESLVASALLDLASQGESISCGNHLMKSEYGAIPALLSLAVRNNTPCHKLLHLSNGVEVLMTKPDEDARVSSSKSMSPLLSAANFAASNGKPLNYVLNDRKRIKLEEDSNNNGCSNQLLETLGGGKTHGAVLQPNTTLYQIIATSLSGKGMFTNVEEVRKIVPNSNALQSNGHNVSNGLSSPNSKRRAKRKSYDSDGSGSFTNPIKEFRQRQRNRERAEDERLEHLEQKFLSAQMADFPDTLEELYTKHGLNIKFPRVKTTMKRGKAADDSERSSRKKECARRDSKNYRERAKAKRELVVRKIHFLEDIFLRASLPKYQFIFK